MRNPAWSLCRRFVNGKKNRSRRLFVFLATIGYDIVTVKTERHKERDREIERETVCTFERISAALNETQGDSKRQTLSLKKYFFCKVEGTPRDGRRM